MLPRFSTLILRMGWRTPILPVRPFFHCPTASWFGWWILLRSSHARHGLMSLHCWLAPFWHQAGVPSRQPYVFWGENARETFVLSIVFSTERHGPLVLCRTI